MSNEATFLRDLKKSFKEHMQGDFIHFFKIPDMPHFKGSRTKFDIKKPYDCYCVYKGIPIAIEAKFMKDYRSFGLKDLRDNQIVGLEEMEKAGGKSFVFLNVRRQRDYVTGAIPCNRLLIFPWKDFKNREKNYRKADLIKYPQTDYEKGRYSGVDEFLKEVLDIC